jgi:hypothetical protein
MVRLSPPGISALTESLPVLAGVNLPAPAIVKRVLGIAEPVLMFAAEAAGAGVPELFLVVAAVHIAKHLLSQGCSAEPAPSSTSSQGPDGATLSAA